MASAAAGAGTGATALVPTYSQAKKERHPETPLYTGRLSVLVTLPYMKQLQLCLADSFQVTVKQFHENVVHLVEPALRPAIVTLQQFRLPPDIGSAVAFLFLQDNKLELCAYFKQEASQRFFASNRQLLTQMDEAMVKACWGSVSADQAAVVHNYWAMIETSGSALHTKGEDWFLISMQHRFESHSKQMFESFEREYGKMNETRPISMISFAKRYIQTLEERFASECDRLKTRDPLLETDEQRVANEYWALQRELYGSTLLKMHVQKQVFKIAQDHMKESKIWIEFFKMCGGDILRDETNNASAKERFRIYYQSDKFGRYCVMKLGDTLEILNLVPSFTLYEETVYRVCIKPHPHSVPLMGTVRSFYEAMRSDCFRRLTAFKALAAQA